LWEKIRSLLLGRGDRRDQAGEKANHMKKGTLFLYDGIVQKKQEVRE
jgi:hypothetical protein